jgi:hypothetical protein
VRVVCAEARAVSWLVMEAKYAEETVSSLGWFLSKVIDEFFSCGQGEGKEIIFQV